MSMRVHRSNPDYRPHAERTVQIRTAIEAGHRTYRRIARALGVSESLVRWHCRRMPDLTRTVERPDNRTRRAVVLTIAAPSATEAA